jgi:hypothetical protein
MPGHRLILGKLYRSMSVSPKCKHIPYQQPASSCINLRYFYFDKCIGHEREIWRNESISGTRLGVAQITIDLDESVTKVLKQRAKLNGTSLEEELLEQIARFTEEIRAKYGTLPDSTPLIREERDRRS